MKTRNLFSPHYLERWLPDHQEWNEDLCPAFEAAGTLWEKAT